MTASERIRAAREAQAPSELAKLVLAVGEVEPVGNVYTEAEWDAMQRERAAIRKSFDAPTQWGEPTEF